jgi:hypothetical protein
MADIDLDKMGLGTVLKQNTLVVPPNQREYAWADPEVQQLFQDFARAIADGKDYFLGTLVTIPRGGGALEVADGQQRLATTSLLLAAIRDYLSDKKEPVLVDSINEFLNGPDRTTRDYIPKLRLNTDDNDLFRAIVSADHAPLPDVTLDSNRRLMRAYELAKKHVAAIVSVGGEKEHGDFLNAWLDFIEHKAISVLLRVADDADAYKMFETLNARGLRTSQADLVKNHLFSKADKRLAEVQQRWSFMRGALETLDTDDDNTINFLRIALVLRRGYLSANDVYEAVQDEAKSEQGAVSFAVHLEAMANVYIATFNPEHERWSRHAKDTRSSIEVFNLLNIAPLRPLLLAVAAKMAPKEIQQSYVYLVSLAVRLLVATTIRSGGVAEPLAIAARDTYEGKITTAAELKDQLKTLTPTDAQFREGFQRAKSSTAKLARYYLRSLERAAKNETHPEFIPEDDRSIITLEHVLPLNPETNWPGFSEDDVREYVKRLGNLVLLRSGDNSNLKSANFKDKKVVYAKSSYELTSQVAQANEWTPETIAKRQDTLAELATTTWPAK